MGQINDPQVPGRAMYFIKCNKMQSCGFHLAAEDLSHVQDTVK